jgi:hypothetical protein
VFDVDGQQWTLDLREGEGSLTEGAPSEKADLTLTMSDANFAQLVMGKLNPQQVGEGEAARGVGRGRARTKPAPARAPRAADPLR